MCEESLNCGVTEEAVSGREFLGDFEVTTSGVEGADEPL